MSATSPLRFLPIDDRLSNSLQQGDDRFERAEGVVLGASAATVRGVVAHTLGVPSLRSAPWCGYLAVDDATSEVIGTCAFKGPPNSNKSVEIAYYVFPPFERRGYATAMARDLVALAFSIGKIDHVLAHTLPKDNPSTSILKKVGMRLLGEVEDPEDGRVWRWRLDRPH